jgi:hypothetical protein
LKSFDFAYAGGGAGQHQQTPPVTKETAQHLKTIATCNRWHEGATSVKFNDTAPSPWKRDLFSFDK